MYSVDLVKLVDMINCLMEAAEIFSSIIGNISVYIAVHRYFFFFRLEITFVMIHR